MTRDTAAPQYLLKMWAVYPLLVPFYLMGKTPVVGTEKVEGGVPQIADYYFVCLMIAVFCNLPLRFSRAAGVVIRLFIFFVCYTVLVNAYWSTALEDLSLLKSSLFYCYDVALLLTCLALYRAFKEDFLKVTVYSVMASVVLQAVCSPLAPPSMYARQALFFNNENQLGYFCLLAATMVALGSERFEIPTRYSLVFFAALAYLSLISQSRSALLGLGALAVIAHLQKPMRLLLIGGGLLTIYMILTLTPPLMSKTDERFVQQGEYDTLATRGYDRFINYPEYIVLGAGEGAYTRFRSELYASEIHSSLGTLLFCYGIPGTALFALALFTIARRDPKAALFLIPAFIHGFAHQGLRFAFFWTMLAFICCCALGRRRAGMPATNGEVSPETTVGLDPAT